jgi:hypothetical protein
MYKIISRAINNRLNSVINRVCSRAQKGYNSNRYVQEVLINTCETIAHCKSENIRGSVLAVDMAKAFDSLDHNYVIAVLRFFGFGDNIIKYNRKASIIMNAGINSSSFDIETGCPQGDNPSPTIFNFCEQILIFKLELDRRICRIPRAEPTQIIHGGGVYSAESNRETDVNESLADDNTVLSLINRQSLLTIKAILSQLEEISGLHCNFDKTALMPIFPVTDSEREWINEAGFIITNKIKLLGAEISPDFDDFGINFDKILEKIQAQCNYWSRFKLSLPGEYLLLKHLWYPK